MADYTTIRASARGGGPVTQIWLARPEKRNAINATMRRELEQAIDAAVADPSTVAVLLRGEAGCFSAGNDVSELGWLDETSAAHAAEAFQAHDVWLERIWEAPVLVVAVVEGPALGHAAEAVARCDLAIASADAVLGWPEVRAGGVPSSVWPVTLASLKTVKECFITGRLLGAREARDLGLVNGVVEPDEVDDCVARLVDDLSRLSPSAVAASKAVVNRAAERAGLRSNLEHSTLLNALAHDRDADTHGFWEASGADGPRAALARLTPEHPRYWEHYQPHGEVSPGGREE